MAAFKVINVFNDGKNASDLEYYLGEGFFIKSHHTIPGVQAVFENGYQRAPAQLGCVQYVLYKSDRD